MASACALILANDSSLTRPIQGLRSRASTCIIVSISAICVCTLVVCGVMIAREYSLGSSYRQSSSCRIGSITNDRPMECQYCANTKARTNEKGQVDSNCHNTQFPCVRIEVSYWNEIGGKEVTNALLHPDSIQASGAYSQCSYSVCLKTMDENTDAIASHVDPWRRLANETFKCYYDTTDVLRVIVHKRYTGFDVLHSMVWPSLGLVGCAIVFLYLESKRRHLTFCGRKDPEVGSDMENSRTDSVGQNNSTSNYHSTVEYQRKYGDNQNPTGRSNYPKNNKQYSNALNGSKTNLIAGGRYANDSPVTKAQNRPKRQDSNGKSSNVSKSMTCLDKIDNNVYIRDGKQRATTSTTSSNKPTNTTNKTRNLNKTEGSSRGQNARLIVALPPQRKLSVKCESVDQLDSIKKTSVLEDNNDSSECNSTDVLTFSDQPV